MSIILGKVVFGLNRFVAKRLNACVVEYVFCINQINWIPDKFINAKLVLADWPKLGISLNNRTIIMQIYAKYDPLSSK